MKKNILSISFCFFIAITASFAQGKLAIQILSITHNGDEKVAKMATAIQSALIDKVVANAALQLLERDKINVLHQEKELQKSEDFIDGKVVEQGKAMGAQCIIVPELDVKTKIFRIKAIDVEKESVITSEKCDIAEILRWDDYNFEPIEKIMNKVVQKIVPSKKIKVIRFNNPQNTQLLVAVGTSANVKKKQSLSLYYISSEKIEDSVMEREVPIGKGKISEIQGENFSILEINEGAAEIATQIQKGTKIFCKF